MKVSGFSFKTPVIMLKESYWAFSLNRWNILTTLNILKAMKPVRKNAGRIVRRSTIPSKLFKKSSLDFTLPAVGYR